MNLGKTGKTENTVKSEKAVIQVEMGRFRGVREERTEHTKLFSTVQPRSSLKIVSLA